MVAIYTGILLLALLLVALLRDWHDKGTLKDRPGAALGDGSIPGNQPDSRSIVELEFVSALPRDQRSPKKVRVTTQSLSRLQKEAKEIKEMAERIAADATDAEQEIEMLIRPK